MQTQFRAIVELGCECGERLELPFEEIRVPFDCPACDSEHCLGADQLDAIEAAFGRALVMAHERQGAGETAPVVAQTRH
jgi:hypothetical protein